MIEGVLFDLFGTLVDYEVGRGRQDFRRFCDTARDLGIGETDNRILAMSDAAFQMHETDAADTQHEFSMQDSMMTFAKQAETSLDRESLDRLVDTYLSCWMQSVRPLTGIDRLIGRVARRYRVGLISNTHSRPMVDELLRKMNLEGVFHQVTTSVEHGRRKPHHEIFTDTLSAMALTPANSTYVGDNYTDDYIGSTGAGMSCFLIGRHARVPVSRQLRSVFDLPIDLDKALKR